jgi:hypothetical protein
MLSKLLRPIPDVTGRVLRITISDQSRRRLTNGLLFGRTSSTFGDRIAEFDRSSYFARSRILSRLLFGKG